MTTLHPLRDYLLVKRDEAAQPKSAAGIITEVQEEVVRTRGVVLAVGPGDYRDGQFHKVDIEPGAHVVFRDSFAIIKETVDGTEYLLMPVGELVGILEASPSSSTTEEGEA